MVVVTLLDEATMSDEYRARIMENRKYYADRHGAYRAQARVILALTNFSCRIRDIFPRCEEL